MRRYGSQIEFYIRGLLMTHPKERDRTPSGRFKYLAEKRVDKALKAISSISNLSDKKNYEYTQEQVTQIFDALNYELEQMRLKFDVNQKTSQKGFKLK